MSAAVVAAGTVAVACLKLGGGGGGGGGSGGGSRCADGQRVPASRKSPSVQPRPAEAPSAPFSAEVCVHAGNHHRTYTAMVALRVARSTIRATCQDLGPVGGERVVSQGEGGRRFVPTHRNKKGGKPPGRRGARPGGGALGGRERGDAAALQPEALQATHHRAAELSDRLHRGEVHGEEARGWKRVGHGLSTHASASGDWAAGRWRVGRVWSRSRRPRTN